jgi:cytochrome c2
LYLLLTAMLLGGLIGCGPAESEELPVVAKPETQLVGRLGPVPGVQGDPQNGRRLFVTAGCAGCHTLRGVPTASGVAGPNLTNVVLRPTLAGEVIPMSPDTMVAWLLEPSALKPETTMPDVGLTAEEAVDLTAFLYSQPLHPDR